MPPAYEVLLLNTAIPQIQAAQSGDTYVVPRDIAINATAIISANSATDALRITQTGAGNAILVEDSANPDSTPFVVTAAGDVGIGTSSPNILGFSKALTINNATGSVASEFAIGGAVQGWVGSTATQTQFGSYANIPVTFWTNNTERTSIDTSGTLILRQSSNAANTSVSFNTTVQNALTLDSSGNLGLGVTPSAWRSTTKALQSTAGAIYDFSTTGKGITQNAYLRESPNAWAYINNGPATQYDTGSGTHSWYNAASGNANDPVSFIQAMTLDASGNLGVGITSPSPYASGGRVVHIDGGANAAELKLTNNTSGASGATGAIFQMTGNNLYIWNAENSFLSLGTDNTERARITSGGYFKASDDGVYAGAANTWHEFNQSANSLGLAVLADNASFTGSVVEVSAARNTTNNTYYFLDCAVSGVAYRLRVADSGNVTNTNGSYGTISDAKMKTDIVDAGSQWSDIKALRFRKFKMKDDPEQIVQLGVVAQEVEQVSPGLVEEHIDRDAEGNDLGTTTKSVKTSVLLMKAAVALQEAMARIETLEAEVAALKGA